MLSFDTRRGDVQYLHGGYVQGACANELYFVDVGTHGLQCLHLVDVDSAGGDALYLVGHVVTGSCHRLDLVRTVHLGTYGLSLVGDLDESSDGLHLYRHIRLCHHRLNLVYDGQIDSLVVGEVVVGGTVLQTILLDGGATVADRQIPYHPQGGNARGGDSDSSGRGGELVTGGDCGGGIAGNSRALSVESGHTDVVKGVALQDRGNDAS